MSHLLRNTGPSAGFASHIFCRRRGRQEPNCIASGLVDVTVVSFTDCVWLSGGSDELHIRRGFRFAWSRQASREIRSFFPKKRIAMGTDRMMLKPRCDRSSNSFRKKRVEVGEVADVCGPFDIPASMDFMDQGIPTFAGSPLVA